MKLSTLIAVAIMLAAATYGDTGPEVPPEKKLLAWAVNAVDGAYLKEHVRELENQYALDGIVIAFVPDDWIARGNRGFQTSALFGRRKYRRDDFHSTITALNATTFQRFSDNFLYVSVSVRGTTKVAEGNVDWFDDRWRVVAENMALYADIARQAGFKGLMLDAEFYPGGPGPWTRPFSYPDRPDKETRSRAECAAQARRRGREMMAAVTRLYPDITMIIIPNTGWGRLGAGYELLLPFVDGILEGRGTQATIVDGGEQGYVLRAYDEFLALRRLAVSKGARKSRAPDMFNAHIRYGFGLWPDYAPPPLESEFQVSPWHTDEQELVKNFRTPVGLEHALYNALTAADSYVWLYVWHPKYWWNPDSRMKEHLHRQQQRQCALCPHSVMPQAYLEAIRNCRKPHDLSWKPPAFQVPGQPQITAAELAAVGTNILDNADFEEWGEGKDRPPDHWLSGLRESAEVKNGSFSVKLVGSREGHVFVDQHLPADAFAGKAILFGAWVKTATDTETFLSIIDWVDSDHKLSHSRQHTGDGTWQFLVARKTIREKAGPLGIWFRLNANFDEAGDQVYFDHAFAVVEE